mmetsp:Transcript_10625/g.35558  ORF Transcript_10625/g.35558 Transcript_10625/m.35558 type:complete len:965 (-) Transcript_10625:237-3131(-)
MSESPDLGGGSYLPSKHGVSLEVLYERYKEDAGIPLRRFLKFLRDAVLLDNSWTFGQAVTVFFEHSNDEERNQEAGERVLTLNDFTMCMKKVARQSLVVKESSRKFKVEDTKESQENEYYLFEGLQRAVSERLQAVPRSDEDAMLNKFILSELIQLFCLSNEYKMRLIYKRLIKVKSWKEVLANVQAKLTKLDATKFFRDVIPKDQGAALRQDDLYAIFRNASHEITSKESAARELSNDFSFPEFVEILIRCALSSSFKLLEEEDAKTRAFTFDVETDSVAYAAERVKAFWRLVWSWLQNEVSKEEEYKTEDVLMEDCPIYDDASIDMQMLFAHYSTGQAYTQELDFSNPNTAMGSADLIRLCRDAGMMDHRLTYTSIIEAIVHTKRSKEWLAAELNFMEWQVFFVRLAILKYVELPKMDAVTIMVKKWLLPMVYTDIAPSESSDFLFSPRVLILLISYENHTAALLKRYSTERNVTIDVEGEVVEEKDVSRNELQKKQSTVSSFSSDLKEELERIKQPNTFKIKTLFLTLVDLVSFLKTVGFLPRLLAVNELIDIFDSILNVNPSRPIPPHSAQISVSHVVEMLVQCSLLSFGRPPHASKYATREEKVLAGMEMMEVAFYNMTGSVIPLQPTILHPILAEEFKGISQESELREYLLTRRCCMGNALVPVPKLSSSSDPNTHQGKHAQRLYEPSSELEDGKRPVNIGIPCLVREQHFAPPAPHPIGALMETALIHHNSARYKAAVDTYLQACNTWVNLPPDHDAASEEGEGNIQERGEEEREEEEEEIPQDVEDINGVPKEVLLFFFIALGSVYESAGLEELALSCYCEAKLIGDQLESKSSSNSDCAISYSSIGSVLFHMGHYQFALLFFKKALAIRQSALSEVHMDTALLYNNIGACHDMLDQVTEALESFLKAKDVFVYEFGFVHPRTSTVMRNLERIRSRKLDFKIGFVERKPTLCPKVR